jgi:hypothetical protein
MIMLAAVLHRDGEPPEPGLHLSPRGRLVNLGSSGGASASSGWATLRSGGKNLTGGGFRRVLLLAGRGGSGRDA